MKDELLIYQIIEQSADKGIWTKDMKVRSNVPATRLPKILKTLEGRNLIKAVKGVSGGSRKIYMLFELQPSEELTGGTWCAAPLLTSSYPNTLQLESSNTEFLRRVLASVCLAMSGASDTHMHGVLQHNCILPHSLQHEVFMRTSAVHQQVQSPWQGHSSVIRRVTYMTPQSLAPCRWPITAPGIALTSLHHTPRSRYRTGGAEPGRGRVYSTPQGVATHSSMHSYSRGAWPPRQLHSRDRLV